MTERKLKKLLKKASDLLAEAYGLVGCSCLEDPENFKQVIAFNRQQIKFMDKVNPLIVKIEKELK